MGRVSINDQYLTDIGDGIREKLDVQTLYKPSQMKSAILSIPGASTLVSKTITQNGTYDPTDDNADGYSSVTVNVPSSQPNLQSKTVTENGTVLPDTGYDGLSSVIVNVSGGGSNVIVDTVPPTSDVGTVGQLYIYIETINTTIYGIKISVVARNTDYNFQYWGARDIDFVFTNGSAEYHLREFTSAKAEWATGANPTTFTTQNGVINGNTGTYYEHSGLPVWYRISAEVPSGYMLEKVRICGRNDSSWKDFWRSFEIGQISSGVNFVDTLISEENLVYSDWDTSAQSAYTEFVLPTPVAPSEYAKYTLYQKTPTGWIVVAN